MNTQQPQQLQTTMNSMTVHAQEPMAWRLRSERTGIRRATRRHKSRTLFLIAVSSAYAIVQTTVFANSMIHAMAAQASALCR